VPTTIRKKIRLVIAWALGLYLARMYVRNGWIKFDPDGFWTAAFAEWGFPVWFRWLVGAIEVVGGALLLVPWLASWAAAALTIVMLGALTLRLGGGWFVDAAWIAAYLVCLGWIGLQWWPWRWRPKSQPAMP
jgi:uncharacterized membrane protein YphA (DoxX/SURF4 family)